MRVAVLLVTVVALADDPHGPTRFREHVIEASIPGGYSVMVTDINHDRKPDLVGLSQKNASSGLLPTVTMSYSKSAANLFAIALSLSWPCRF